MLKGIEFLREKSRGFKTSSQVVREQVSVAFSNKVMDTPELPQPIKRHVAPKYDICNAGRSMIEMLGVLAIIAVLSVGGIAGYSKAMEMWKVTKLKTRLAELFLQCVNLKDDLVRQYQNGAVSSGSLPVAQIMTAMDVVPEGLKLNTPSSFKDVDNNSFYFYFQYVKNSNLIEYLIIFSIYNADGYNSQKQKFCETFIEQAKAISPYVSLVYKRGYKDTTLQGYSQKAIDFRSANPAEISSFCKECYAEYSCHLHLRFKTNGL